jgi:hypothetical protein
MNNQSEPGNMSDDKVIGATEEPDDDRGMDSDGEVPQDPNHPNLTRPQSNGGAAMTNESLSLLGAGQPYRNNNK